MSDSRSRTKKIVTCKNKEYKFLQIQQNKEKSLQTSEMFSTSMQGSYKKWEHIRGTVEKLVNMRFYQIE